MTSSVVFIDYRVADHQRLIKELAEGTDYFILGADSNGIRQMAFVLSGYSGLSSIQVISHGDPGNLLIGSGRLDTSSIEAHADELAQIGRSLTETGDILLYGCNVAQGELGLRLAGSLARHTSADVAASTNFTGSSASNGDWQLEVHTGNIEATGIHSASYGQLLALPTGSVTIAGTVAQNQILTASNTLADTDGLGTITYQWQSSSDGGSTWNNASTGSTLTLTEPLVDHLIRVVANYTDALGTAESATSSATAAVTNVNDTPSGSVIISGTTTQGQVLTATNTLADVDGLGIVSYQWQSFDGTNWSPLVGSTTSTLTLTQAMVGKQIRAVASFTDGHGASESVASSATSSVTNVNDSPTGSVSITGTVALGQTLTASNTLADSDGLGIISYQWQSSSNGGTTWSNLSTGTTLGLSAAQVGGLIRVIASYTDGQGSNESIASSATSTVTNSNNLPTGSVTISGTATQGQALTASNTLADTDGLGTITYQWQSSSDAGSTWSNLSTGTTLTLAEAQVGKLVRAVASYTDGGSTSESVASSATAAIANTNDNPTGSVTISGTAMQNQTLTASNSLADADGLGTITYQWQNSSDNSTWNNLSAGSTVTLAVGQVGEYIRVIASYTDGHGTSETSTSTATSAVLNPNTSPTGSVTISGTVAQNQTLTASNSLADADGLGVITYQWQSSNDSGTTWGNLSSGSSLALTESLVDKLIRVTAAYSDGQGTAESVPSAATTAVANINDALTGAVTITGSVTLNQVVTASNSITDADGLGTITYQWQSSSNASIWSNISTGATLGLSEAQVGKYIRVVASYTDSHGTSESAASNATSLVANTSNAPTGSVAINGTSTQGQTLTASNNLADADGPGTLTISYQWQSSPDNSIWTNLNTGTSLTLTETQVGKYVRVIASYTDGGGTNESVASSATTAVANVNDNPGGSVSISGTAMQNQTLTASNTLADTDGLGTISYQWQSSIDSGTTWSNLSTGSTLGLSAAQVGRLIRVVASYTDGHSTNETVTSTATSTVTNPNTSPTGSIAINGTAAQGQTLTASNTLADADGLGVISYQWQSSSDGSTWTNLGTTSTQVLTETQVGSLIRVVANYSDGQGTAESVTSSSTSAVINVNDALTGSVAITGTVSLNQVLTASNSFTDADGLGTVSYAWQSSSDNGATWSNISGGLTLGLSEAQVGKNIRVVASYTDGHGTAESATSTVTSPVTNANNAPTGSVTVTGTATQGQILTASNTLADADGFGTSVTYQWQNSSDGGTTWSNLGTGTTITLAEAQVGKLIRATATYTDSNGTGESVASSATATIANINDNLTGSITIIGNPYKGQTLTVSNSLADPDGIGTLSYLWQSSSNGVSWSNIGTGSTLGLSEAHIGKQVRAVVSYTDGHGTQESANSNPTSAISNNQLPSGSVVISGNVLSGQTLTASHTLTDPDGLGIVSYQWQSSIDGSTWNDEATGNTFSLHTNTVGTQIRVVAYYLDTLGTSESVTSNATATVPPSLTAYRAGTYIGTSGDDIITSDKRSDKINAGAGNDVIYAGDGNNRITAGAGNDIIVSGRGADIIDAGGGNDMIYAGGGKDRITLGLGSDVLVFDNIASGGADTVSHFNATEDLFAFQAGVFLSLSGGISAGNIVISTKPTANDQDDFILFNTKTGKLFYDSDGNGTGNSIHLATVKVIISGVTADSFTLM